MSVGIGMGIGRGHVTLGHAGNNNPSPNDPNDSSSEGGQISPNWSVQCWDTLDQVDHLILLPERALTMDSGWLQADLAEILAHSVIGHGRGVTPGTTFLSHTQRPSSQDGSDSWSPSRRRSLDWSLVNPTGQQSPFVAIAASSDPGQEGCPETAAASAAAAAEAAAAAAASAIQREERSKVLRERQNEERQRKLEELKQQALATQKFREQQEEDRRRRMEETRLRDLERRSLVEERKKAIMAAELERREAMLRRSEDRGIRQEIKRRNERGSIAFAFGSSTPRMLEPVDSCSSYWGSRRATSTTNVMSSSTHGRVTMNEVSAPSGGPNNKRASSVFGLDQNQGDDLMTQSTSAVQSGRRKRTDLIPTMPMHRGDGDRSPRSPLYASSSGASSSRGSVSRSTGLRSGDITPSSPTRPLSALSQVSSVSTTVASSSASGHVRARTAPAGGRKPRPVSIAGTGMSLSEAARTSRASRENISRERSKETKEKENERTRQTQPRPARARSADMRKDNNNVQGAAAAAAKSPENVQQTTTAKRSTRDIRTARTPVKTEVKTEAPKAPRAGHKTEEVKPKVTLKVDALPDVKPELPQQPQLPQQVQSVDALPETDIVVKVEECNPVVDTAATEPDLMMDSLPTDDVSEANSITTNDSVAQSDVSNVGQPALEQTSESTTSGTTTPSEGSVSGDVPLHSRKIISSEEEAKAALAEKRRLAREQMEREAERERLRAEEERRLEEERQRQEELEQKLAEEEMDRLAQQARQAEEERLQKAIEETQRREEEERLRREEEVRQRAEKEQQDRKAREEAERLRKENEERLRREEEERQERRKRVEAIMARTRGKSSGPGKSELNTVTSGQSTTDVSGVGMSNSNSQPDLLGDIVNKTNGGNSNGQSSISPDDSDAIKKNNGFHIDATDSSSAGTTIDLPDISNVIANSPMTNADSVNSNANNNIADEHVEIVA